MTTEEPVECTTEESLAIFNKYCGAIKDPEGKWLQYLSSHNYDVDQMYDGCKLDICSYQRLSPDHLETIACESMSSLAKIIEEDGDPISWRDTAFCRKLRRTK